MPNPLADVSQEFWQGIQTIDNIMARFGAETFGYKPLAPQFRYLQRIDTDRIRQVAQDVWRSDGLVDTQCGESTDLIARSERYLGSWEGEAKDACSAAIAQPKAALEQIPGPADNLGQVLQDLADGYDRTLIDIIVESCKVTWQIIEESGAMPEDPGGAEDKYEAWVRIIIMLIAVLIGLVYACVETFNALQTNMDNVQETIEDCQEIVAKARV